MIKGYKEGANISVLNTIYIKPFIDENGKWTKGSMNIIYKDLNTGEKHLEYICDPEVEYYMVKEGIEVPQRELYMPKESLDMFTVKFRNLDRDIALRTGNEEFYNYNVYNKCRSQNRLLHSNCKELFASDIDIEDFYRFKFNNLYRNEPFIPTKAYFDIEVDIIDKVGDYPEPGECPINAITYIDQSTMAVYTLLLRNGINEQIQIFEDNKEIHCDELPEFIKQSVGEDKFIKYNLNNLKYKFIFYDEEIKLICDFFTIVEKLQPDFIMAWNMRFDLPYIYERINALGYNPLDIMCDKKFCEHMYYYHVDQGRDKKMSESSDYCKISSFSVWLDQMRQFACKRKSVDGAFKNWKLDYIGEVTTGIRKLDYSHITRSIAKLPYLDYKTFVYYNIMDVIVQYCIEFKSNDVDYILNKCIMNNTRYAKCHNQTIYLVNRATKEFFNKGYIISNNKNKFNPKPSEKFPGAHVADPNKINPYSKYKINDIPIYVFDNLDDYDFKAEYPSIINQFNIATNTQIGRIYIPTEVYAYENMYNIEHFNRSSKYIEDLHSHNFIEFCYRWFKMAGYKELCEDIQYYYSMIEQSANRARKTYKGNKTMLNYTKYNTGMLKYNTDGLRITRFYSVPERAKEIADNINVDTIVYREIFEDVSDED